MGKTAIVILNVDHVNICKYERAADGYLLIVDRLARLHTTLLGRSLARPGNAEDSQERTEIEERPTTIG